jgi:hypothetical protein
MDRTTIRGIAFWTTVVTSLITLMTTALYAVIPFAGSVNGSVNIYRALSVVSLFFHVLNTSSLLLFLGMIHYDLVTAQRLSEHARDYLIRDLTQSPQENRPNHG